MYKINLLNLNFLKNMACGKCGQNKPKKDDDTIYIGALPLLLITSGILYLLYLLFNFLIY